MYNSCITYRYLSFTSLHIVSNRCLSLQIGFMWENLVYIVFLWLPVVTYRYQLVLCRGNLTLFFVFLSFSIVTKRNYRYSSLSFLKILCPLSLHYCYRSLFLVLHRFPSLTIVILDLINGNNFSFGIKTWTINRTWTYVWRGFSSF